MACVAGTADDLAADLGPPNMDSMFLSEWPGSSPGGALQASFPLTPLAMPLSPAFWMSAGLSLLSPVQVLSPFFPSFLAVGSPPAPALATPSLACSSRAAAAEPELEPEPLGLVCTPSAPVREPSRPAVVQLSMPPRRIERRAAGASSLGSLDPSLLDASTSVPLAAELAPAQQPARRTRGRQGLRRKRAAAPRLSYRHVWREQRDAVTELLAAIGFDARALRPNQFACSLCGETFRSRTFAVRHALRTHVDGKPFGCEDCGVGFARADTLVRHMKRKHGLD